MKRQNATFFVAKRQEFREYFQPSRIVIAILKDGVVFENNFITLCFCMHAAYKPTSMAFAVEKRHHSHGLLKRSKQFVLAIPGPALIDATLFCGLHSGRQVDKAAALNLRLAAPRHGPTPWLADAIANIELTKSGQLDAGDHDVFVAVVDGYFVNNSAKGPGLLSVGANHYGYQLLARHGIHRIAVPYYETPGKSDVPPKPNVADMPQGWCQSMKRI